MRGWRRARRTARDRCGRPRRASGRLRSGAGRGGQRSTAEQSEGEEEGQVRTVLRGPHREDAAGRHARVRVDLARGPASAAAPAPPAPAPAALARARTTAAAAAVGAAEGGTAWGRGDDRGCSVREGLGERSGEGRGWEQGGERARARSVGQLGARRGQRARLCLLLPPGREDDPHTGLRGQQRRGRQPKERGQQPGAGGRDGTHGSRLRIGTTGLKMSLGFAPPAAGAFGGLTVLGMMTGGGWSAMARRGLREQG